MKAWDLMVNDCVYYLGDGEPKVSFVNGITELQQLYLWSDKYDASSWVLVGEKYVAPIPLTPEILENNKFERIPQERCANPYYWRLENYEDGDYLYSITAYQTLFRGLFFEIKYNGDCEPIVFTKQIEFLHELQHALRLVDLSKVADTFKV